MIEPVEQFPLVCLVAFVIRLLYTPAGRRIISGDSQPYHRSVGEWYGTLNQTFSEGTTPYDYTPVPILNRSRKDFTCRSRALIDQQN